MEEKQSLITLWARLGVSFEVTPAELAALKQEDEATALQTLLTLIRSNRCRLNGETYFPLEADENRYISADEELKFQIQPTPLHSPPEHDFSLDTPHGTLHIYDKQDDEYPGVWIDLQQPGTADITLAMVEYIPGGEGLSDYIPSRPDEMRRQLEEVPETRRTGTQVTAGFVTRSWPDDTHDNDTHKRTFHSGYSLPQERCLDNKLSDAQQRVVPNTVSNKRDPTIEK